MLAGDVTFFYITDHIRLSLISYFETSTGCCIGTSLESWWGAPEDASMGRPLVLNRKPYGDVHRTCFGKFRRTSFGASPGSSQDLVLPSGISVLDRRKIITLKPSRKIEEATFTYCLLGKSLEKQTKIIEKHGKKPA